MSLIWGCAGHEGRLAATERWYRTLLEAAGAATHAVAVVVTDSSGTVRTAPDESPPQ